MKVAFGADHGGLNLKNALAKRLQPEYEVVDLGAYQLDPEDDYPDFAAAVAGAVASGKAERGILICGSGVGACVAANKINGVRACLCHDTYSAHQGVEHDDLNVLCLGACIIGGELAFELASAFLKAEFKDKERYRRRLNKVMAMEHR